MLHAVIMAGGSGTRFWPLSRRALPKQFLKFAGDRTLIQDAAGRCPPIVTPDRTWVVTNAAHAVETARQLPDIPASQILVEPCGRNTAPCIGLAAIQLLAIDPDATMLVMPADHVIQPAAMFQQAVREAEALVAREPCSLVLFGIEPTQPVTGFGYIQRGEPVAMPACGWGPRFVAPRETSSRLQFSGGGEAPTPATQPRDNAASGWPTFRVQSFQEKPNQLTAARYVASGHYYWNCGIFVWRAQAILDALATFAPEITVRLKRLRAGIGTPEWPELLEAEFPLMPSISIDYAVLEKTAHVCVLEAPFDWDDVGSWQALPRLISSDRDGNTQAGLVCGIDTTGCIVRTTEDHLIATIGVKDLIIVHTPSATLVADKRDESSVRQLITELERRGLAEYL